MQRIKYTFMERENEVAKPILDYFYSPSKLQGHIIVEVQHLCNNVIQFQLYIYINIYLYCIYLTFYSHDH